MSTFIISGYGFNLTILKSEYLNSIIMEVVNRINRLKNEIAQLKCIIKTKENELKQLTQVFYTI